MRCPWGDVYVLCLQEIEARGPVLAPPQPASNGSPQQTRPHTLHAVLCGDFNFLLHEDEYARLSAPWAAGEDGVLSIGQWHSSWNLLHQERSQHFDWGGESLRAHVRGRSVNSEARYSSHQPLLLQLD